MWEQRDTLKELGVSVLIFTFESQVWAKTYHQKTSAKWPLLIDTERRLYKLYNMNHANFWDIWGPSTWLAYFQEALKGKLPTQPSGDIHQRGGDVLIDDNGIIQLHHVGKGPADRPSVDLILRKIKDVKND